VHQVGFRYRDLLNIALGFILVTEENLTNDVKLKGAFVFFKAAPKIKYLLLGDVLEKRR
jgi:hypothetical protein